MTAVKEAALGLLRRKRFWAVLLVPLSLLLNGLCIRSPEFTERFISRGVYPAMAQSISFVTGLLPFSLIEVFLALGVPLLLVLLARGCFRFFRRREERRQMAAGFTATLCCAAGIFSVLYVLLCGAQYSRLSFAELAGLPVRPSTAEELGDFCEELTAFTAALREQVPEDENGVARCTDSSFYATARKARTAMDLLAEEYPVLEGKYSAPKPVFFSKVLSALDLEGVFCPFTMEANVNRDSMAFSRASTMCHEQAHLRGFIREDEANYIACRACLRSEDPSIRYSGAILAVIYSMNQLYEADRERFDEIYAGYSGGMLRDLAAHRAYWKQFEGPVSDLGSSVNDAYLKANRQQDGVQSYGRMVDLLLAEYRQKKSIG